MMLKRIKAAKKLSLNIKSTGSVHPSSRFLVKKVVNKIQFKNSKLFVELGGGNGCITKKILSKMRKDDVLIVFERSKFFFDELKKIDDSRLIVVNNDAVDCDKVIRDICDERSIEFSIDNVVSTLPLSIIGVRDEILNKVNNILNKNGRFIQIFYVPLWYDKFLRNTFDKFRISFIFFNIPPTFVYTCYKK